jgi:hypothetical protein
VHQNGELGREPTPRGALLRTLGRGLFELGPGQQGVDFRANLIRIDIHCLGASVRRAHGCLTSSFVSVVGHTVLARTHPSSRPSSNHGRITDSAGRRLAGAVPDMVPQIGGSISFAPQVDEVAKWQSYDTRTATAQFAA